MPRSSIFLLFTILMAIAGATIAARDITAAADTKDTDLKQPEWFYDHDGSFLIPGIGRVMVPTGGGFPTMPGNFGGGGSDDNIGGGGSDGSTGAGGTNGGYIPGGDDTFVPNPGVEIPNPVGGGVPP